MLTENAQKWVEALRSGEYTQTTGGLRDATGYCCLGVACEEYRKDTGDGEWDEHHAFAVGEDRAQQVLPTPVQDWLGLRDPRGQCANARLALSSENDGCAHFARIADIIESEPAGLFRAH